MLQIHQFPCLSDNYGFLIHDPASGATAAIDTPDADEIMRQADAKGWRITDIWNTHWHPDHAGGNAAIKAATGARITGPAEVERIGLAPDRVVAEGEDRQVGGHIGDDGVAGEWLPAHQLLVADGDAGALHAVAHAGVDDRRDAVVDHQAA